MGFNNPDFISTSFAFPFNDRRGLMKVAIGSLLILASMVIPLVPLFFVAGYCLRIIQRIILDNGQASLPEWDDWESLIKNGFKLSEAGLLYALPGLLIFTAGYIMIFFPLVGTNIIRLATGSPQPITDNAASLIQNGTIVLVIGTLLCILGGYLSAPAAMHMAAKNDIKAVFEIKVWWKIMKAAAGKFIGAYLLILAATGIIMVVFTILSATLILCLPASLLFSVGSMYISLVASALFATAYRTGLNNTSNNLSGGIHD
jgi:hypothetical protein